MNKTLLNEIIDKVQKGIASDEEMSLYNSYLNRLINTDSQANNEPNMAVKKSLWQAIENEINPVTTQPKIVKWARISISAAAILMVLGIGYFSLRPNHQPKKILQVKVKNDVLPGGNKAFLTLSNGEKISLTDAKNGTLVSQANMQVKNTDGELVYKAAEGNQTHPVSYNTLTTPKGGTYNIVLSDGTKVWLNASSIIRFPEVFGATERKVELIAGEAYFEVAHNAKIPFKVITPKGVIEDIGTVFNVNAYQENTHQITTLIEGVLSVAYHQQKVTLKPGQQALLINKQENTRIKFANADLEEVTAWKNGLFLFNDENLESIMQKVARWYDVKVIYQDESVKQKVFLGVISRFKNASEVMKMLEQTGNIQFSITNNQIIIRKK